MKQVVKYKHVKNFKVLGEALFINSVFLVIYCMLSCLNFGISSFMHDRYIRGKALF